MDLFSINGKFFHFMYKVADLIILSALWLVCSLPLFTLGAATTTLYYCVIRVIRESGPPPTRTFFRAFRENFRKSTLVTGLVVLAGAAVSLAGTGVYALGGQAVLTDIYTAYLVLGALAIAWLHYVFSYLARFDTPVRTVLKNSLLILLTNLPMSISMVVLFAVAWGGFALTLPASLGFLFLLPGVYSLITSYVLERIYRKYLPEEEEDE